MIVDPLRVRGLRSPYYNNIFKGLAPRRNNGTLRGRPRRPTPHAPPAAIQIMEIISTYVHLNKYHSVVIIKRSPRPLCSYFAPTPAAHDDDSLHANPKTGIRRLLRAGARFMSGARRVSRPRQMPPARYLLPHSVDRAIYRRSCRRQIDVASGARPSARALSALTATYRRAPPDTATALGVWRAAARRFFSCSKSRRSRPFGTRRSFIFISRSQLDGSSAAAASTPRAGRGGEVRPPLRGGNTLPPSVRRAALSTL
ncbi:hypothetical protein EVAR_88654_1 [Eumeta japonica]|uniref:Uncharacterized protein n=1 Tax=Eumeta variegata TaxID=151549 RepID=A0A4C1Y8I7_EUMVA|nr:hypothetical protein EVAR_88654_1 [Eumeta japonica]